MMFARRCAPLALASLLLGAVAACGGYYVTRGADLYADGRYVEAAEVFERTEYRLVNSSPEQRAQYAVFRGATLLALGDLTQSHRWLAFAYDIERSQPGTLDERQRAF